MSRSSRGIVLTLSKFQDDRAVPGCLAMQSSPGQDSPSRTCTLQTSHCVGCCCQKCIDSQSNTCEFCARERVTHPKGEGDTLPQLLARDTIVPESLDVQQQAARQPVQPHALGGGCALLADLTRKALLTLGQSLTSLSPSIALRYTSTPNASPQARAQM